MRSTLISIILFFMLLGGIFLNSMYVRDVSYEFRKYSDTLSHPTEEAVSSLEEYWYKHRDGLGLSISGVYLDSIEKTIVSMRSAYESGDIKEFRKNLALFRQSSEVIGKSERISLEIIL